MDNKEYIIGIDIGSSNVVMAAGVRNKDGEISFDEFTTMMLKESD